MGKRLEASDMQQGACIYCGQLWSFETIGLADGDKLDEWATEKCDCSAAKAQTQKKKSLKVAKEKIKQFFPGDNVTLDILDKATDAIYDDHIEDITINIGNGVKAKVSTNRKGNIKVERTVTTKLKYEQ